MPAPSREATSSIEPGSAAPRGAPRVRTGWRDLHQWRLWLAGLVGSRYDGLTHFQVVEPGVLLRCGQPRIGDLETIRAQHGLRTVVCARGGIHHPLRGRWFRKERAWCARRGIELVHMPFSDAATPPAQIIDDFLSLVADPHRRPVLVHCEQGFHRTGILCAAYRVRCGHWRIERAVDEMRQLGFETERAKRRPLYDAWRAWAAAQV